MYDSRILNSLFYPKEVAVIGATAGAGKTGNIILKQLIKSRVKLYPVHPKESVLEGIPVVNNVSELPDNIDLAVITIGALGAVESAEICAAKGTKVVIIIASGFGEAGEEGRALEKRLGALPSKYGTRVLGPNTLGVFMPESGINTIFVEHGGQGTGCRRRSSFSYPERFGRS